MPRMAIAALLLVLIALAGSLSYTGYLVVGVVAEYLGIGRVLAGLLLGVLFARLPSVREGKLRTIGLLPKRARLPVMLALLAFCMLSFFYRSEWVPVLFLGFAAAFLLMFPKMKQMLLSRAMSSLFRSPASPHSPHSSNSPNYPRRDDDVIDVEFKEKKD